MQSRSVGRVANVSDDPRRSGDVGSSNPDSKACDRNKADSDGIGDPTMGECVSDSKFSRSMASACESLPICELRSSEGSEAGKVERVAARYMVFRGIGNMYVGGFGNLYVVTLYTSLSKCDGRYDCFFFFFWNFKNKLKTQGT